VNWGTTQTFTLAGATDTNYTLLPVFQAVTPPLPSDPILPSGDNVGKLSRGIISQYFGHAKNMKHIELSDILKQLGRSKI